MIYFFFETHFKLHKKKLLEKWLKELIIKENAYIGDINFIFCDDKYLLKINRLYLQHNFYTDIITFDYTKNRSIISGDIFISVDRVKDNALEWKQSFGIELCRVMTHGVLHLLGYKDKKFKQKKLMREREDFYLSLLFQQFEYSQMKFI